MRTLTATAREPRRRTIREFAEQEIVVADGPFPGRFHVDRQPFARLFFDEVQSGRWTEFNIVGCVQSGKTLIGFVIITLYHLFEVQEAVICGVPDENLAKSKWLKVIRPAIVHTRYERDLPHTGEGSREGARITSIYFRNGATLRFMSGGGMDAARASETARVVVITETSKLDARASTSQESDKISQLKARTKAFDDEARVYLESTPTIEDGAAWQNHVQGSASRIALPCPLCACWAIPTDTAADRDWLIGWKEARDEIEAGERGAFACPHCGQRWTEEQRRTANLAGVLVHRGQRIEKLDEGMAVWADKEPWAPIAGSDHAVVGPLPRTRTLSFRWSAVHNLLRSAGNMAAEEWRAARAVDEENAQRAILQNLWALPYAPDLTELTPLRAEDIQKRRAEHPRGLVPDDTVVLSAGIDLGKWRGYYVVTAWTKTGGHVVEYGCLDIATDALGVERATLAALREFRDRCATGWPLAKGGTRQPIQVWIDTNYADSRASVIAFCRETNQGPVPSLVHVFRPLLGRGGGAEAARAYTRPSKAGNVVHFVGEGYHLSWFKVDHLHVVEINVDQWKSWVHDRLAMPPEAEGAIALYAALPAEHLTFAKHLTAEKRVQAFVPGKGMVTRWERLRPNNHYFDALVYAAGAGHYGRTLAAQPRRAAPAKRSTITTPDGRPFLATER